MFSGSPRANSWGYVTGNVLTTQPAAAMGTSFTADNATWTSLVTGANVAYDCYEMVININSAAVSIAATNIFFFIGVDPSGGTSYTNLFGSFGLPAPGATAWGTLASGFWYTIPIFVKAGSQVAIKAQSDTNARTGRCCIWLRGRPSRPDLIRWGTTGVSFTTAAITPGTTSEGAWASIGSVSSSQDGFYVTGGVDISDTTMGGVAYSYDIGISSDSGTTVESVCEGSIFNSNSTEGASQIAYGAWVDAKGGTDGIYGRMQCSGTVDSGPNLNVLVVY